MATRRARIKAVTSLPPRRKNNEGADSNKVKTFTKEEVEKLIKSPKTPRGLIKSSENAERNSPKPVPASPRQSPRSSNVFKYGPEMITSPTVPNTSKEITSVTPVRSEKVSVITSTSNIKTNVFVSPRNVGSPLRKPMSPRVLPNTDTPVQNLPVIENRNDKSNSSDSILKTPKQPKVTEISMAINSGLEAEASDNYSVPSVPESITEDGMDGIVPLQPVTSGPKPIALLKNEIISENAEVLFDPIVPLPSPSKVRPKLRPVPRLTPLRRNSVQGSASESEDESRRALHASGAVTPAPQRQRHDSHASHSTIPPLPIREMNRVRNDSICSSVSQSTAQPPAISSPVKEKMSKARRNDMAKRMAAMRRRRETVKRDPLTMYDLIFYNPTTNPIVPDQDELKIKEANEAQVQIKVAKENKKEDKEDEDPDDPPEKDAAPVPQIKLGPNGEIILDEQSLVIQQSESRKVSMVVHEGAWSGAGPGRYRRAARTADWSDAETVRFYRALAALGTDFMLMERLFPGRTRKDLKLKFKKEERINGGQIDKALRTSVKWDCTRLEEEFKAEREAAERKAKADAERLKQKAREEKEKMKAAKELRIRQSRGSKVLGTSILPGAIHGDPNTDLTADDIIKRHHATKERKRKSRIIPPPPPPKTPIKILPQIPTEYATITKTNTVSSSDRQAGDPTSDLATLHKIAPAPAKTPDVLNSSVVPSNIESGSLVVLTVNDPNSPSKKMLQTYIAHGGGKLTPIALPTSFLNSVVSYMKKGTPKSTVSTSSSPHLTSPSSVASQDSRTCSTPGVIQLASSPRKRQRHSSCTVMQL